MGKKKTKRHLKPNMRPHVNYKTVSIITVMEERMNRIAKQMWELTMDPRPLELVRDAAAQMCEETCKLRVFACDQADGE